MKRQFAAAAILALALVPAAFAKNDAMSLIPNDSVSVGVVRLADMRSSPLSAALFAQTAQITNDDDAMKFLREAGFQPTTDIATAFVLVDVPRAQRITGAPKMAGKSTQSQALGAALKNVSTVAIWATDTGDSLKLSALGLSSDSETLGLVEDTLRGALSAMRLA